MASGSHFLTQSVPQSGSIFIHSLIACCLGDYKIICTPKEEKGRGNITGMRKEVFILLVRLRSLIVLECQVLTWLFQI